MEQLWAVIKDGIVVNVIVADQAFVDSYYPGGQCIDDLDPKPGIGWHYNAAAKSFSPPKTQEANSVQKPAVKKRRGL